jgi:hypothetical protein
MLNTANPTCLNVRPARLLAAMLICLILVLCAGVRAAGFGNDVNNCAADRPCFNEAYQSGNKVVFKFTAVNAGWDVYNVRYKTGGGDKQVENRSGSFVLNNCKPNRIYTISVQGCTKHTFGHSTCSPWSSQSVTTR